MESGGAAGTVRDPYWQRLDLARERDAGPLGQLADAKAHVPRSAHNQQIVPASAMRSWPVIAAGRYSGMQVQG